MTKTGILEGLLSGIKYTHVSILQAPGLGASLFLLHINGKFMKNISSYQ